MKDKRPRLFVKVDKLALMKITEHITPGEGASVRSVWMALEQLANMQRDERHGRSIRTSQAYIAKCAEVSIPTVKRVCAYLEEIGLLTVTNRKTSGCRFDLNLYSLKYPKAHNEPRNRSSPSPTLNKLDIQRGMASMPPPLPLRVINAMPKKLKPTATAKHETERQAAEQQTEAEERRREKEVQLAENKERVRIKNEQRWEEMRLEQEKLKADQEAAQLAEDARRLARRADVGSCKQAIMQASFDEYDPGTFASVWSDYNGDTVMAAVVKLSPTWASKVAACMKNNAWLFDDAPEKLTSPAAGDHAADHGRDHVSDDPRSPSTS